MYPRDQGEELMADQDAAAALATLRDVRALIDRHRDDEARLRAVIESAMGDATALVAPGVGRVTWKASRDTETTDWKAVAADLRTWIADADLLTAHELDGLVAEHTTTKPGSRRFVPSWDKEETHG